ncbi:hypothetical protein G7Y79_00005g016740 [Physcia stellaris]|nr:hypothetical protein G7Y79_00005g016740 [Physcia stellaris]
MPVNKARTTFALPPLDEHGMVQLPMGVSVNHGGRGIIATVDVDARTEVSSWYDIWAAYHAIATLCIGRGHTGFARIGDHGRLIASIKPNRAR